MPTMIRPKRTFAANNATATPQTLAPSRARAQTTGTKKPGYRSSRAVTLGADNGASAYSLRGSAPASAACRRPRQLAKNAPRFLYARSFTGSSPCDGPITKKPPLLGALSINGAGERTSAYPLRGSAPASAACRRPRQLAKNAPRFLYARSFTGSSPCDGPITKKPPLLGALSINGAGERT